MKALRDSLPADATLTSQNCSFAYLSKGKNLTLVEEEETIQSFLDKLPPPVARQMAASPEPATVPTEASTEGPVEDSGMDVDPTE